MQQRMGAGEIQIFGITMSFRHRGLAARNVLPVQMNARQRRLLDATPAAEPMQPIFQFVIMPGHDEEEYEEAGERAIAELSSPPFVNDDGCREPNRKNCKPPAGEPFTDP